MREAAARRRATSPARLSSRAVRKLLLLLLTAAMVLLAAPADSLGHAERRSYYPNFDPAEKSFGPAFGAVPRYRSRGPAKVVCKRESRGLIKRIFRSRRAAYSRRKRLALLDRCRFRHIQAAVNAAGNGDRILIMPGVYREEPSRRAPLGFEDARCEGMTEMSMGTLARMEQEVPSYRFHLDCPNAFNLIAIVGDDPADPDRRCDSKCNLQLEGMGRRARDVIVEGDQRRENVIRADRADGIYIRNLTVQYAEANDIYAIETNGFRWNKIVARWAQEYGVLTFTSDTGVYENLEAYGSGDSGVYPGSGPEGHCKRYGIEIRNVDSHHNNLGYSGTAGNGVYAHDSKFHDNGVGMVTDSIVPGHPGMPQDCAKWERNEIYSNNLDLFGEETTRACTDPQTGLTRKYAERDPKLVCSTFPVPVGTGLVIVGNGNIVADNHIYDNWRAGAGLAYVGTFVRGNDDTGQSSPYADYDVNHDNRFTGNRMGVRPDGTRDPNGTDFLWDGEGRGNCWGANTGPDGAKPTVDTRESLRSMPECPEGSTFHPGDAGFQAREFTCLTWDPNDYDTYPPCGAPGRPEENWWALPAEPR